MIRSIVCLLSLVAPALAAAADSPGELAQDLRQDWDMLGLSIDATSSHTLAQVGPQYRLISRLGLYIDAGAGIGVTLRSTGDRLFGQGHAYAGWSLVRSLKNKKTLFNLHQSNTTDGTSSVTTYTYLDTEVIAERNVIAYGGVRSIVGRGPDLASGEAADGYFALAGGLAFLTTWRQEKEKNGVRRLMRGIQGVELTVLYTPQDSASTNFSRFRHWGGEVRFHRTTELGRMSAPFHLGLGIEPGLGPMLRLGMTFPVATPLAGRATAKVGEVR